MPRRHPHNARTVRTGPSAENDIDPPPLGTLQGMVWDPERRKYFPENASSSSVLAALPLASSPLARRGREMSRRDKPRSDEEADRQAKRQKCARARNRIARGILKRGDDFERTMMAEVYSTLYYHAGKKGCPCGRDLITSLQTLPFQTLACTTANGQVITCERNGEWAASSVCSDSVLDIYYDLPRMTEIITSGGPSPHLHISRQTSDFPELVERHTYDIPGTSGKSFDMLSCSRYDTFLSYGLNKKVRIVDYANSMRATSRKVPSDPLALHQTSSTSIYYGLRNGAVHFDDLREKSGKSGQVARCIKGKAVIGVRKLNDGAVPFGLAVSALSHELLIFDARFGSSPLHTLPDHVNDYQTSLGWAFSPDDKFLFTGSSDGRIRLFSTITGQRKRALPNIVGAPLLRHAPGGIRKVSTKNGTNPLLRKFEGTISALAVRDDWGLDVGAGSSIYRFAPAAGVGKLLEADLIEV